MNIRYASIKDIPKIIKLYLEVWGDKQTDIRELKKYFNRKIKNKEGLIAIDNHDLIGFLGFSKEYFRIVCSKRKNFLDSDYLEWVFIDKSYRRKGIAEKLIKKLEQDARKRKIRRIFSTTIIKNKSAIKLHKKTGYSPAGYVNNLWEEGDKELFFSKKL